jgi:uncharacterized protein (TIGR00730 family)
MAEENKKLKLWNPSSKMIAAQREHWEHILNSDEEFENAFKILEQYPKRVTIFGSARDNEDGRAHRDAAYQISYKLAEQGYAVVSGGGNGIMAASNRGAYDAGGVSIGFNIMLPHEQKLNPYTTHSMSFDHFFTRKVTMTFFAHAYVYFPGGFGTLDELTEIVTLIQTKKMPPLRIVLFGSDFWSDFDAFVHKHLLDKGYISPGDQKIYTITDDVDEVVHLINSGYDT